MDSVPTKSYYLIIYCNKFFWRILFSGTYTSTTSRTPVEEHFGSCQTIILPYDFRAGKVKLVVFILAFLSFDDPLGVSEIGDGTALYASKIYFYAS